MIKTSINQKNSKFLDSFNHVIKDKFLDKYRKNKLDLFVLNSDSNEFDYENFKNNTENSLLEYALSRKTINKYKKEPVTLVKKAKEKFVEKMNEGELGELLLFCFLELHLNAPKILSKLELKTSNKLYVNGADGVHLLELENGDYQIIFGESKTKEKITDALTRAFKSIYEFKEEINSKGDKKSGLPFERGLVTDNLVKEFSKKDQKIIEDIIYPNPSKRGLNTDTAFGIFIGYEIKITDEDKKLSNSVFRIKIQKKIKKEVESKFIHISKKIDEFKLSGHNFYIYILPFSNLEKTRNINEYFKT